MRTLFTVVGLCSGQVSSQPPASPAHYLEIKLPRGVISEKVFIRYLLSGEEFGGWVRPVPGVSSYFVGTTNLGRQATRIKALLYAPGCAIQILDLPVSESSNPQYNFACRPLPEVEITGTVPCKDRLIGRDVKLQAKYVARWAQSFLELGDGIVTTIPIGDMVEVSAEGRFRLPAPDFSQDPLAGTPDHPGDLQIWAIDKANNTLVAQLVPTEPAAIKARMGGLKIRSEYPSETVFARCATNWRLRHGVFGFAVRQDACDECDR